LNNGSNGGIENPCRKTGSGPVRRGRSGAAAGSAGGHGRSLLIVSPEYGPVHRWIALLTNLDLQPGAPLENRCGDCRLCIDSCPQQALTFVPFADHPGSREEVLDITACRGDDSCLVCLEVCPWLEKGRNAGNGS